jgi:hypothetical protein
MTPSVQDYIMRSVRTYPMCGLVLEVGSYDVNGNPRHHFADKARFPGYLGIDMREGPGVDLVMNCHRLELFSDGCYDVVVDAERLEHDDDFFQSYREIQRVVKTGGYVIVTTRSWNAMPPHYYPSDYWRFMSEGLSHLLRKSGFEVLDVEYGEDGRAVFATGRKL